MYLILFVSNGAVETSESGRNYRGRSFSELKQAYLRHFEVLCQYTVRILSHARLTFYIDPLALIKRENVHFEYEFDHINNCQ